MKSQNRKTGQLAEDIAADFLKNKGYQIIIRNFHNRFGEIDIIALDGSDLVFAEVKAKKGINYGKPEDMINARKLQRIMRMAEIYMNGETIPCRIDVIAITLSQTNEILTLNHYENVWL